MKKLMRLFYFLFFYCGLIHTANGDIEDSELIDLEQFKEEPMFISLGSFCQPSHMLRYCELRKAAFPFDWIMSLDGEALIEILEDDFKYFLSDEYFVPYGPAGHLLNTYYHLEFLHEGDFNGSQFLPNIMNLKIKYQRRIDRFRQLSNYRGKIIFLRTAFLYSMTDPNRFFKFKETIEITEEYSLRLYKALKNRFPNLNFSLIIINLHDNEEIEVDRRVFDSLLMVRYNPLLDQSVMINAFKKFFAKLLEEEAVKK